MIIAKYYKNVANYSIFTVKTIKYGTTVTYDFTDGKNKKTYEFRVRAFTKDHNTGKKIYSKWSTVVKCKFKKKSSK